MTVTEYQVVIACPEDWSQHSVELLAGRLANQELPQTVGVYIYTLTDGKLTGSRLIREGRDDTD